jgi:tetratricopeptide (TPR) repeat protein
MRSALAAHPNSDMTRRIQQEAARTFDALFLAGKGDALPAIDALALFYDFRELTPIGRRGDEMIRRLADRLVAVDLLDQAAELLQYQVDNRLQGAARAQVATRLAVIYLMNRKADRALATLRATRAADLTNEVRNQRLLLEARALSDMGRHDVALEVIGNLDGREVIRLRSDIYWAGRHWREAAEQIELLYGERWKDWQPLNDIERSDILRAELGYALGEDTLGLGRFREKYAAKMAGTPDAHAFEVVSALLGTSGKEFAAIAHAAAAVDTLDGFLRDMQARYPDASAAPPASAQPAPPDAPQAGTPAPAVPPIPSIVPPPRASGRTALR